MMRSVCAVSAAALACACLAAEARGGIILGENLLNNHGAEAGPGGSGQVVPIPGWSVTEGSFTVAAYGATPALLDVADPGPSDRGQNYFTGGSSGVATAEQRFNLFPLAASIDAGNLTAQLSGWLGSAIGQPDLAGLSVTFLDAGSAEISASTIGPLALRGVAPVGGLFLYDDEFVVPVGAREAVVELSFVRTDTSGFNDGAADELSFVLVPAPGPAVLFALGVVAGSRRRR